MEYVIVVVICTALLCDCKNLCFHLSIATRQTYISQHSQYSPSLAWVFNPYILINNIAGYSIYLKGKDPWILKIKPKISKNLEEEGIWPLFLGSFQNAETCVLYFYLITIKGRLSRQWKVHLRIINSFKRSCKAFLVRKMPNL